MAVIPYRGYNIIPETSITEPDVITFAIVDCTGEHVADVYSEQDAREYIDDFWAEVDATEDHQRYLRQSRHYI